MSKSVQTIAEFCADNSICRATLYNLWDAGIGPRKMVLGRKILITNEAAAEWRKERELASTQTE